MKRKSPQKNQNQIWLWVIGVAALGLISFGLYSAFTKSAATLLMGDAWDYTLSVPDLGDSWSENERNYQTAFEIGQPVNLPGEPTAVPEPVRPGLQSLYYVDLSDTTSREAFVLTSQVVLFNTVEAAQAALNEENPGKEWEKVKAAQTVGAATVLWHLLPIPEAPPDQETYRIDFHYLNAIHSLAVTGRKEPSADGKLVLSLAQKALAKMQKNVTPPALQTLTAAQKPDLRPLLLTQRELAALDNKFGERWVFDDRALPMWTPNSMLPDAKALEVYGRVMGYQTMMIKALSPEEAAPTITAGLFQQVTAYKNLENAQTILEKMEGLGGGQWTVSPGVGDSARAWSTVLNVEGEGTRQAAFTEITFRVDTYIASVRVQTMPILTTQAAEGGEASRQLALKLAESLAKKLRAAQK